MWRLCSWICSDADGIGAGREDLPVSIYFKLLLIEIGPHSWSDLGTGPCRCSVSSKETGVGDGLWGQTNREEENRTVRGAPRKSGATDRAASLHGGQKMIAKWHHREGKSRQNLEARWLGKRLTPGSATRREQG